MIVGQTMRDQQHELTVFRNRLMLAGLGILVAFGLLLTRFTWLQVVQREYYHTLAEANRISVVPVVPNRGLILDRNGEVLAANYSAYTLEITPSKVPNVERAIDDLAKVIDVTARDRRRFKKLQEESKNFESLPIRTRLTEEEVARFAVNRYRFPGFEIKARLFRSYPQGEVASHAIGYIGRINDADVKRIDTAGLTTNYKGTDHIGKLGIEGAYEKELHGLTGTEQVEIDAGGRAIRSLARTEPISGNNLMVTLDLGLQKVAEEAFQDYRGALVAIDPKTGEILALVSKPGYDPNLFVDGIDPQNWDALNNSPDKPLNNRALRGQYPPGSTIKPFMGLAALEYKKRSPEFSISDPGFYALPGVPHRYRDHKKDGHGSVNMHKAIVVSCDTYFYGLATEMGIDSIHRFLDTYGFGNPTGIDIEGELSGLNPSQEWKQRRFKQKWYSGDTVSIGIGQGVHADDAAAARGRDRHPRQRRHPGPSAAAEGGAELEDAGSARDVRARRRGGAGEAREPRPDPRRDDRRHPARRDRGARGRQGPLHRRRQDRHRPGDRDEAGRSYNEKRIKEEHRDHALLIAFAPADDPKLAIAILVENGGHGGATAGPIAREVFDYHLLGKKPAVKQKLDPDEGESD